MLLLIANMSKMKDFAIVTEDCRARFILKIDWEIFVYSVNSCIFTSD